MTSRKAPTVLFPYPNTHVGGSYVSSALLVAHLGALPAWEAKVVLPERGINAALFEREGFTPDFLNLGQRDPKTIHPLLRRLRVQGFKRGAQTLYQAWHYVRQHRPDIVHINNAAALLNWGLAARLQRIPVIWHVRDEKRHELDRYHLWLSDYLIFVASANRVRFESFKHLPPYATVHNAVDLTRFYPAEDRRGVRARLGLDPSRVTLGFVGNLVARKRPEWAVQATVDLLKRGHEVQLLVVGSDYSKDGSYQRKLERLVSEESRTHIHFLGYREDVPELMRAMDILMLSSVEHGEAFPRAVIEAMASGAAVVATRVAGVPEAIDNGAGILVDSNDYSNFLKALSALVGKGLRRKAIAGHAYQEARNRFSAETCAQQVVAVYEKILNSRSGESSRTTNPLPSSTPQRP